VVKIHGKEETVVGTEDADLKAVREAMDEKSKQDDSLPKPEVTSDEAI
jgi:hypothetical protein